MLKIKQFTVISVMLMLFVSTSLFASVDTYGDYTIPYVMPDDIAMCGAYEESQATIQPVKSGLWTDNSVWPNNTKPTSGDVVVVPSGRTLTMAGTCRALQIRVSGTLNAVNTQPGGAWINLETGGIIVENGGLLEIGTEAQPYHATERCVITLTGNSSESDNQNRKAIMVMSGGQLELHGKSRKSWTNIATTADVGATQISLREAVEWEVGDKIALTSTALADKATKSWEHVDESEIIAISADKKTLTLKDPLNYKHIGGSKSYTRARDGKTWDVDIYGEVGLLSHYIKIQGKMDGNNESDGYGGHIMIMQGSTSHSEHIELYKMGQKGVKGRYPYHWHINEDDSEGSYLKNSSVHKSFNRAVTIHGTDKVIVDGVFAYDHIGHGVFLEDGGERYNTIKNNVVFVTRRPAIGDEVTPSDNASNNAAARDAPQNRTPASYWITNPNNYFENNVAAGTEGTGFWLATPNDGAPLGQEEGKVMGLSGLRDHYKDVNPVRENLGKFDGFVVHTCMNGWDFFDHLSQDHALVIPAAGIRGTINLGWKVTENQYFENGLLYGNDQALYCGLGVNGDPTKVVFRNCAFSDNNMVTMLAADITIENTLFNVDTELGVFTGIREFYRFYDGPGRHYDCHFEGWERSNATMFRTGEGGATTNFNVTFKGTSIGSADYIPFKHNDLDATTADAKSIGLLFKDYDGGLLGKAHTTLIRDIPFLRDGHEYRHPSWRNAARSDYYFASLWINGLTAGTQLSIVRSKLGTDNVCFYEDKASTYKVPMIVNEDFLYTYSFDQLPTGKSIHLIWNRGDEGDLSLSCFKGLAKLGNFTVNGHQFTIPRVNSKAEVENATNTSYFIDGNGDVYIKWRCIGANPRVNVFLRWDNNGTYQTTPLQCTINDFTSVSGLDTDGDGTSDIEEVEACQDPNDPSDFNLEFSNSNEMFSMTNINADNVNSAQSWLLRADNQSDPYIYRNNFKFNGSQLTELKVRAQSQAEGTFQLFWATSDSPNFSGDKSVSASYTTGYQEMTFDMSGRNDWEGKTITKLRLDFPVDASINVHTWIDYIHGPNAEVTNCVDPVEISFQSPTSTQFVEGDDLGVVVSVDAGEVANIKLYMNNVLVRQEGGAPYEWGTANPGQTDALLMDLPVGTHELKAIATDNNGGETVETMSITVNEVKGPYLGSPTAIPGTLEFENYDKGGSGVSYNDTDEINLGAATSNFRPDDAVDVGLSGGAIVIGWTRTGEWIEYTVNVEETADYDFNFYSSSHLGGGLLGIDVDGNNVKTGIEMPITNDYGVYTTFTEVVPLTAGEHVLRFNIEKNGFNLDKVVIAPTLISSTDGSYEIESFFVYPNPSEDGLFNVSELIDFEVHNIQGHLITKGNGNSLDLSAQPKGVYILYVGSKQVKLIR